MNKILKSICYTACILVFCFLTIGYAALQDDLTVSGSLTYIVPNKVFAVYGEAFDSNGTSIGMALNFYNRSMPKVGDTITLTSDDGTMTSGRQTVTKIYDEFNDRVYGASAETPWYSELANINTVTVVDEGIAPKSTAYWFSGMTNLNSAELKKLDTKNTTDMNNMFFSCPSLLLLDLSGFNTKNVTNMSGMFGECTTLSKIIVGKNWNTDKLSDSSENMFLSSLALTGGAGTVYDSNEVDKKYAKVDGGTNAPGYLTYYNYALVFEPNFSTTTTSGTVVNVPNMKIGDAPIFDISDDNASHTWAKFLGWSTDYLAKEPMFYANKTNQLTIEGIPPQCSTLYAVWECVVRSDEQLLEILENGSTSKTNKDYTVAAGTYGRLITARENSVVVGPGVVLTNEKNSSTNTFGIKPNSTLIIEHAIDTQTPMRGSIVYSEGGTVQIKDGEYSKQHLCSGIAGGTIEVTGGNFTIFNGFIMEESFSMFLGTPTLIITGGTFNKDPSKYVPEGYLARDNGDGTWTVVCKHPGAFDNGKEFTITPARHSGTCEKCGAFDEKHIFDDNGLCLICGHQTIANLEQLTNAIAEGKGTAENPLIIGTGEWSKIGEDNGTSILDGKHLIVNDGDFIHSTGVFFYPKNAAITINGGYFQTTYLFIFSKSMTIKITAGEFNISEFDLDELGENLEISGGTFSIDPSNYLIQGYIAQPNGDGTWTVVAENS